MVMLLADRLASTVAPASAASRAWRDRHPEVLADLDMDDEAGDILRREHQVRAERDGLPAYPDFSALGAGARCEMPLLVELAVVRQVDLGHGAQHPAPVDRYRAVIDPAADMAQRRSHQQQRQQLGRAFGDGAQGRFDRIQQRVLKQQVVDRVTGHRQFREDRQCCGSLVACLGDAQDGFGIGGGVGDAALHGAGGNPRKTVTI